MNKHNRRLLISLPVLVAVAATFMPPMQAGAQEEPSPVTAPVVPESKDVQQTPTQPESTEQGQTAAAKGTASKPIKEFKPSEEIGADSAVSFPIDI